ncbi:MAG TPA: hypothetical protein RMH85_02145 [Polyangiaceae bacterium LLY-WYZ-15_(1-7)]|nr:hypothetical protein [Myxococcales bacterium]MAT28767.1 hypothetical protein [Sandaracinus sp.]HJL00953.1 hypothetical protein [Polyangiaceae bacterium LLY-WYZ-15_(1-7)]MBJ74733.1 hypothetical protein [Sandaracinus sp.]HJL07267.1 hypothetical protein [Polyangiaceae bacterium LLY-WYZ-15_(1-7)]
MRTWSAAVLLVLLAVAPAWADRGVVRLTSGQRVSGEIIAYEPGRRVVIRGADGRAYEYPASAIVEVRIEGSGTSGVAPAPPAPNAAPVPRAASGGPAAPPSGGPDVPAPPGDYAGPAPQLGAPTGPPPPSPEAQAARREQLLEQRRTLQAQEEPSLTMPIAFLATGVALLVTGAVFIEAGDFDDHADGRDYWGDGRCDPDFDDDCRWSGAMLQGFLTMLAGGVFAGIGAGTFIPRMIQRGKRRKQLRRIDRELRLNGWAGPESAGLRLQLRF